MVFTVDVDENKWGREILTILLTDRTMNRNIIWATSDYEYLGKEYHSHNPILIELITNENSNIIKPRVLKTKENQENRIKDKAEVFTPSWICNEQNNLIDKLWFGRDNVFNKEENKSWKSTSDLIIFPDDKNRTWKKYIDEKRLEITCGEAPYLVSRYDTATGVPISLHDRIGLLDRKMRIVHENTSSEEEWLKWSERAFQSIYGFEFQGDSLLLARENLLASYCDYMLEKLHREPTNKELLRIANIISWNLWQMDGLTYTIPYKKAKEPTEQLNFLSFGDGDEDDFCIIKDWRAKKNVVFRDLVNGGEMNG